MRFVFCPPEDPSCLRGPVPPPPGGLRKGCPTRRDSLGTYFAFSLGRRASSLRIDPSMGVGQLILQDRGPVLWLTQLSLQLSAFAPPLLLKFRDSNG